MNIVRFNDLMANLQSLMSLKNISLTQIAPNRWRSTLSHEFLIYPVDIMFSNGFINYGAPLLEKVRGRKIQQLLKYALEQNGELGGAQIGMVNDRFTLVRSEHEEGISEATIMRDLQLFNRTHEYAVEQLTTKAQELGLYLDT